MKYYVFAVLTALTLTGALTGCSKAKKEAYVEGCKAGIREMVSQLGMQPAEGPIAEFCKNAADKT